MGHLFSRAFRRITQSASQSRNQEQQQQQQQIAEQQDKQGIGKLVIAESIPVGQSIDSAEYAALNDNKDNNNNNGANDVKDNNDGKQGVEEAVIKIQALVRGHLTRKALKDAHQHSAPNALGQSQFDEDSLTRNPPTAFFLPSSPLNLNNNIAENGQQQQTAPFSGKTGSSDQSGARSPLESIAEVTETTQTSSASTNNSTQLNHQQQQKAADGKKRLSPLSTRSASSPSNIEIPSPDSRTVSPVPSEANASIDLCCETPASASIDILDHNIKPIDKIASVLHHKEKQLIVSGSELEEPKKKEELRLDDDLAATEELPLIEMSDSLESEEAAAIRIQSAFRGYRTRKNSPYRTRSPQSAATQAKRHGFTRQQEASVFLKNNAENSEDEQQLQQPQLLDLDEQQEASQVAQSDGRRSSRTRYRESSPIIQDVPSFSSSNDFSNTEEDTATVKKAEGVLDQQHSIDSATIGAIANAEQSLANEAESQSEIVANTLSETGLTAALETAKTVTLATNQIDDNQTEENRLDAPRKVSAKESEASFDTDSSALGAALSMNSEEYDAQGSQQTVAPASILYSINENKSTTSMNDELEFEARRLVEEMQMGTEIMNDRPELREPTNDECALEEATQQLESVLEDSTIGVGSILLDEEEQRAIELESDDIERRDPRGHASGDRSKSPQIKTERPTFDSSLDTDNNNLLAADESNHERAAGLSVEQVDDGKSSGRSSPALVSSGDASSEEEEEEDGENSDNNQQSNMQKESTGHLEGQQKHQSQQQAGGTKNKKRNNRKKRKGKK